MGPNGHPIRIGGSTSGTPSNFETLHWNGDQLLFTTNASGQLDDIKIGTQGEILPLDSGYNGLTFYDRQMDGAAIGCHNATGASTSGQGDQYVIALPSIGTQFISPCYSGGSAHMPTSVMWWGSPPTDSGWVAFPNPIGQGGVIGMPRTDGIADGTDLIQGVRTMDSNAGTWTTPDAFTGMVENPASQKSYMWNGNNPVMFTDPTGYDAIYIISRPALDDDPFQDSHTFIEVVHHDGSVTNYSFGPGKNNTLARQNYKDDAKNDIPLKVGNNVQGITKLASCNGTCSVANGGFNEASLDKNAAAIDGSSPYGFPGLSKIMGSDVNSNSATYTLCAEGGGGGKCNNPDTFGHLAPGWGYLVPPFH